MDVRTSYLRLRADVRGLLAPGRDLRVDVGPPGPVDLHLVGEVARLHLAARRCGARLVLHDRDGRLAELLRLTGLGQDDREPDVLEQLGADEVVDVGDPPG